MKNANWTRILTILLCLLALYACLAVLAGLLQRFIVPVLLVLLAAILAFILTPIVDLLQGRFHFFRWLAILTTYLLLAAVLGSLGYFLTSPLVSQTKALADAIKNPTHIENVVRVRASSKLLGKQATTLRTGVLKYVNAPNPGPKPCQKVCPGFANCYLAYYLGDTQSLFAAQGNCIGPLGFWRVTFGPHWRKRLGPTIPALIVKLQKEIAGLGRSTVSTISAATAQHQSREARIPVTKVPPGYTKPLKAELALLNAAVAKAQAVVAKDETQTALYIRYSNQILKGARAVSKDARSLYSLVHSTPIIILALQNQIDSHHLPIDVRKLLGSAIGKLRGQGTTVLNNAVAILTGTVNVIFDLIIIVIMSLYLLADGPRFIGWVMSLIPEKHREQAWFFVQSLSKVLGGYVRGQLIVAITIGILAGLGCYAIGVPYALLLGIFAFLAESIPVMGPVLASIPAIIVSLFTLAPLRTAFVVGWFILIQQVEQNVVGPRITGRAVGIHPVAAMIAVIIGLEIGGIWGAFLAVPVTGVLFVVVSQSYSYLVLRKPLPTAEIPVSVEVEEQEREQSVSRR
jgi:predicted PurR-regulated permease PerM